MSRLTHYTGYFWDDFMGQMTQPTKSTTATVAEIIYYTSTG